MALEKITEAQLKANGVCASPDVLNGTPAENKSVFDRMIRNVIAPAYNACVEAVNALENIESGMKKAESERKEAEEKRQTAEAAREAEETGYVAQARSAANSAAAYAAEASVDAKAAAVSQSAAKTSEEAAAESARLAAQAALGQIPDGSLERIKFAPAVQRLLAGQNLLDNSHFYAGALVDQRKGYLVEPGAYFTSLDGTKFFNDQLNYYSVIGWQEDAGNQYPIVSKDGILYKASEPDAVPGYQGKVQTVDRWKNATDAADAIVTIGDDGLVLSANTILQQVFEDHIKKAVTGVPATFSVLTDSGLVHGTAVYRGAAITYYSDDFVSLRLSAAGNPYITAKTGICVIAAKFELGNNQTLAYLDDTGNWVLNDVPDYNAGWCRCRNFQRVIGMSGEVAPVGFFTRFNSAVFVGIPLSDCLRAKPSVSLSGKLRFTYFEPNSGDAGTRIVEARLVDCMDVRSRGDYLVVMLGDDLDNQTPDDTQILENVPMKAVGFVEVLGDGSSYVLLDSNL